MSSSPSVNGASSNGEAPLYESTARQTEPTSPWEVIRKLWRGKWLILGLAALMAGGAYYYWQHQPKRYRTSAVLMLENDKEQLEGLGLPVDQPNYKGRQLYFLRNSETFSRTVAERLSKRLDSTRGRQNTLLRDSTGRSRSLAALTNRVHSMVRVQGGGREEWITAIELNVTSYYPQEAALLANTYAQTYVDHLRRSNNEKLQNSRRFLERQRRELKERLRAIEDTITAYVRKQGRGGVLTDSDSSTAIMGEANQIASDISELRLRKEEVELKMEVERAMLDTTQARLQRIRPNLAERASSVTAEQLRQTQERIAKLQAQIQEVQVENGRLAPKLKTELNRMRARLKRLKNKSRRLAEEYVKEALSTDGVNPLGGGEEGGLSRIVDLQRQVTKHRINVTELKARRAALTDRIESRQEALRQAPDRTLPRLKRRKNLTEELYLSLSKNLQKIQVSEESTPKQAQVLQRAEVPLRPIGPNVRRNVLMAFFIGGLLGTGLVLLYDRIDNRIERPEDIEQGSDGLFGVVPLWQSGEEPNTFSTQDSDVDLPDPFSSQWPDVAPPYSPAAEAYRHLATNLRLGTPTDIGGILVTSSQPREGKSTTTVNLGMALSEVGLDVLLVDGDFYGATLHQRLNVERAPGLSERLAGQESPVQVVLRPSDREVATSEEGDLFPSAGPQSHPGTGTVGLLPAGTELSQPSLLVQEEHAQTVLQDLQADWDLLLLDSPPLLTYDITARLAAVSDMALVLAAAGETDKSAYDETVDRLNVLCSGPVTGVLNKYETTNELIYGYGQSTTSLSRQEPPTRAERFLERTKRGFRRLVRGA